jgi:hypothetical protein
MEIASASILISSATCNIMDRATDGSTEGHIFGYGPVPVWMLGNKKRWYIDCTVALEVDDNRKPPSFNHYILLQQPYMQQYRSKHLRWIMVQVAHAASKKIGSKLRKFYIRIRARKGAKVAIVALARKILCILHHLLMNQEMYKEPGAAKKIQTYRG